MGNTMTGKRKNPLIKWIPLLLVTAAAAVLWAVNRPVGVKTVDATVYSLKEMLLFLPPIFILLGLLDTWVPREKIIAFMGEGSGLKGIALAFLLGTAAAGPLYAAFPVAQVLLKKGASLRFVLIFLGAWSTTKIPMLMFELANLGARFTLAGLAMNVVGTLAMAFLMEALLSPEDRVGITEKAKAA